MASRGVGSLGYFFIFFCTYLVYLLFTGRDVLVVWFVGYIFFRFGRVMTDMYEGFFNAAFCFGVLLYSNMSVVIIPYLLYSTFLLTYYFSISYYQY